MSRSSPFDILAVTVDFRWQLLQICLRQVFELPLSPLGIYFLQPGHYFGSWSLACFCFCCLPAFVFVLFVFVGTP